MIHPISRFTTGATLETRALDIITMFESQVSSCLPDDVAVGCVASKAIVDLEGLYVVCQVRPEFLNVMVKPFGSSTYLEGIAEGAGQCRALSPEYLIEILTKMGTSSLITTFNAIVPNIELVDVCLRKLDRRKRTLYVAVITSKVNPRQATVFAFTSQRKGARIALFNDLLSITLRSTPTIELGSKVAPKLATPTVTQLSCIGHASTAI